MSAGTFVNKDVPEVLSWLLRWPVVTEDANFPAGGEEAHSNFFY